MSDLYQPFLNFALELAQAAAGQIRPYYQNCTISRKSDGSEVTEADREAEIAMRKLIAERYPDHGILGEEFGAGQTSSGPYCWVLDPIDGTAWFALGTPLFGTLVALLEYDEPVVGVIHFPLLAETVYAVKGGGCWFKTGGADPIRLQVSNGLPLSQAYISASGVHSSDLRPAADGAAYPLSALIRQAGRFRFCGDCMQYALVCRGRLQLALDPVVKPWDIAAIVPCIEEAGGVVTTLAGERERIVYGGSLVASCDPALHQETLKMLRLSAREK